MEPVVTVIVPAYNSENTIEKCINSLINQTLKDIEIIVINDNSTDNTLKILNKYNKKINIINNSINLGPAASRNKGLDLAKGKYIGFVDSDDYVEPQMYEIMANKMTKQIDLVCCGRTNIELDKQKIVINENNTNNPKEFSKTSNYNCDKLFKKYIIDKYNLRLPENYRYAEDFAFLIKYKYYAKKMVIIKKPFYNYVINSNSLTKTYNNNLLDIINVLYDTVDFFKKEKVFNKYEKELLEVSRGFYIRRIREFNKFKNFKLKKDFIKRFKKYFKENYKDYKEYSDNFSKNSNIIFKSNYMILLLYIIYTEIPGGKK